MNKDVMIGMISDLWLYVLLTAAVIGDLRHWKISNRLIFTGWFLGLAFSLMENGIDGVIRVLPNMFLPVILLFIFYLLGALGPGDIKLFSVIGCYFEYHDLIVCMFFSFGIAGLMSLYVLIKERRMQSALCDTFLYFTGIFQGKFCRYESREVNTRNKIHFTIAILAGALAAGICRRKGLLLNF